MRNYLRSLMLLLFSALAASAWAQLQPMISNVQVGQRAGTKLVDITYDLAFGGGPLTIWVEVSSDGGRSYIVPAKTFSGHIGQGVQPGAGRTIVWNAEADFDGLLAEQMRVRINARAGSVPIPPPGMVLIPGGYFQMGEWLEGSSGGTRTVYISPFFMDRYEVSGALWEDVRAWSTQNGYSMSAGNWRALDHPVQTVFWNDAVKWCNARSEKEGLTPVYYTDLTHTTVYRTGNVDLTNAMVKWNANGYRLPTEAEWEKAARGGLMGKLYPWGDSIDGSMANYSGVTHPWSGTKPRTTPVGYYNELQQGGGIDMANGYGLYDMAGNVREYCWDRWNTIVTGELDPRGPEAGTSRVVRDGSWNDAHTQSRISNRSSILPVIGHTVDLDRFGFRCLKTQ